MNIREQLKKTASKLPTKNAIIYGQRKISFTDLKNSAFRIASALNKSGIKKGDKILTYLPNIPEFVEIYLGALSSGVIVVPIDFRIIGDELKHIVADSDASAILATINMAKPIKAMGELPSKVKKLIIIGQGDKTPDTDYLDFAAGADPVEPDAKLSDDDEALFLYTSGSTGKSKGVILQYKHLDLFPESLHAIIPEYCTVDTVMACILPMSHITGPILVNTQLKYGNALVIFESWRPDAVWKTVERERVNLFNSIPPHQPDDACRPKAEQYDLHPSNTSP